MLSKFLDDKMNNFNHIILTRFNVKINKKDRNHSLYLDTSWLQERFNAFENFCYPSIKEQTKKDFKWIVFFDVDTPQLFKERISSYKDCKEFTPAFVNCIYNDNEAIPAEAKKKVLNELDVHHDYVLTTRLDSDDALGKDFVKIIQNNFIEENGVSLNLIYGYVLYDKKLYLRRYDQGNPFISLVENVENFKGAFQKSHQHLHEVGRMKNIKLKSKPSWLQVCHKKNIFQTRPLVFKYTMNQSLRCSINKLNKDFAVNLNPSNIQKSLFTQNIQQLSDIFFSILNSGNPKYRLKLVLQILLDF